jgi:tRNA U34 5-carboxymethylaminomethyl modifying GTPase MnmE/TrmE
MILKQFWLKNNFIFSRSSTIFALATGHQIRSGVAIIRISGLLATQSLLKLTKETNIEKFQPNKLYLKKIYDYKTNDLIDQCMTVWFKGRNLHLFIELLRVFFFI